MAVGRPASGSQVTIVSAGTSGTGKYLYQAVSPAATTGVAIQSASFTESHPEDNRTILGATSMTFGNMRGEWSVGFSGRSPKTTRKLGHTGLVTVSSGTGYVSRVTKFTLAIDWGENDVTPLDTSVLGAGAEHWKFYRPRRLLKVSGSWEGIRDRDNSESAVFVQGDTAPAMVFKLSEEGATDNTFALSGVTIGRTWTASAPEDGNQQYGYTFVATGAVTVGGSTNVLDAGAITEQVMDSSGGVPSEVITIDATGTSGANRYEGFAYLKSLELSVDASGIIEVRGDIRGTGAITSSTA